MVVKTRMQKINKTILLLCATVVMLFLFGQACYAEIPQGSLTVEMKDVQQSNINGIIVKLCEVATLSGGKYELTDEFKQSGVSVEAVLQAPTDENAKSVTDYVVKNNIYVRSCQSVEGKAVFSPLDFGIYVVFCEAGQSHYFKPYFVFLPQSNGGQFIYDAVSAPKTEVNTENDKSVYVMKKWDDNDNAAKKRPEKITVELKRDGKTVASAILSDDTGWAYSFTDLADGGKYTVEEKKVDYYKAEYNGDSENGFIITNTYTGEKLAQTGQYWWPIVLLTIAGCALILLGVIELKGKRHESKKH